MSLYHAILALHVVGVIQLWLIKSLLDDTPKIAVDQTGFRKVRFGRVKRELIS